jgi:hypothetical protein
MGRRACARTSWVGGARRVAAAYGRACPAEDAEIGSSGRRPHSTVDCTALRIGAHEPSAVAYKGKELWTYVGRGRCSAFLPGCSPAALCWAAGSDCSCCGVSGAQLGECSEEEAQQALRCVRRSMGHGHGVSCTGVRSHLA